jgi:hypothetical protein
MDSHRHGTVAVSLSLSAVRTSPPFMFPAMPPPVRHRLVCLACGCHCLGAGALPVVEHAARAPPSLAWCASTKVGLVRGRRCPLGCNRCRRAGEQVGTTAAWLRCRAHRHHCCAVRLGCRCHRPDVWPPCPSGVPTLPLPQVATATIVLLCHTLGRQ